MRIKSLKARQIINSAGFPTLQVEISTPKNTATSSVPLASSKSKYEFLDAYDNDLEKFNGETLDNIVKSIEEVIAPQFIGKNSMDQEEIDNLLLQIDGTINRSRVGVNTISAISQTIAKLGAKESDLPLFKYIRVLYDFTGHPHTKLNSIYNLPKPIITVYQGAAHNLKKILPVQEIMVIPSGKFSYLNDTIRLFNTLNKVKIQKSITLEEFLNNLTKNLKDSKLSLGMDMAASRYKDIESKGYIIPYFTTHKINWSGDGKKLLKIYINWIKKYNISFVEDFFAEDDYSLWHDLKNALFSIDSSVQIVSDDFTATNIERLEKVSVLDCCNNVVVKPSQIGTITECIQFAQKARKHGHKLTVSYRKGETEDDFISDLGVGLDADMIRIGFRKGSEYLCKINRLIQIEDEVNN